MHQDKAWTESALIEGIKAHNPQAFRQLYTQYSGALYGLVHSILRDERLAAEALQDTFVRIWQHIERYQADKASLFTWMMNIARNRAIDLYRTQQRQLGRQTLTEPQDLPQGQTAGLSEDTIHLREHVQGLGLEQAQVLDLLYYQGYTQVEAAEALNIPLGTVKSRLRLAIQKLRKLFSSDES